MIFAEWRDAHDKRVQALMERDDIAPHQVVNFNLVGIRRRLNNIEMAAWLIVAFLAAHVWRHW